jgi:hypothetical protein
VILRCTKKLLAVIGPGLTADPAPAPDTEDWYANLLWFDRHKCLLLTHQDTLFSVFEPDVTASSLRATGPLMTRVIERELQCEGLPALTFGDLSEVTLTRTADRRVLGSMNDMAFRCEHVITESGGLKYTNLAELNQSLRRNITSTNGYQLPIELAARRLDSNGRGSSNT